MASREENEKMEGLHRRMKAVTGRLVSGDGAAADDIQDICNQQRKLLVRLPPVPRRKYR